MPSGVEILQKERTSHGLLAGTIYDRPPRCERCDQPESDCTCPPPEPVKVPRRNSPLASDQNAANMAEQSPSSEISSPKKQTCPPC